MTFLLRLKQYAAAGVCARVYTFRSLCKFICVKFLFILFIVVVAAAPVAVVFPLRLLLSFPAFYFHFLVFALSSHLLCDWRWKCVLGVLFGTRACSFTHCNCLLCCRKKKVHTQMHTHAVVKNLTGIGCAFDCMMSCQKINVLKKRTFSRSSAHSRSLAHSNWHFHLSSCILTYIFYLHLLLAPAFLLCPYHSSVHLYHFVLCVAFIFRFHFAIHALFVRCVCVCFFVILLS